MLYYTVILIILGSLWKIKLVFGVNNQGISKTPAPNSLIENATIVTKLDILKNNVNNTILMKRNGKSKVNFVD